MLLVPLDLIDDNPFQARTQYVEINELALNIQGQLPTQPQTRGLLQLPVGRLVDKAGQPIPLERLLGKGKVSPATLRTVLQAKKWRIQLLFGHRRRLAFQALLESRVPPYTDGLMPIRLQDLNDPQMLDGVWGENENRQDISDIERAELLQAKLTQPKADGTYRTQAEVAEDWGLQRSSVANLLRLLRLPPAVQAANRQGELSQRQCLALLPMWELAQVLARPDAPQPLNPWGKGEPDIRAPHYHRPIAPELFIEQMVNGSDTTGQTAVYTAKQIRHYTTHQLAYVGETIPPELSSYLVSAPATIQPRCHGCHFRVQKTCLFTTCLAAKRKQYGEELVQELAQMEGVAFSQDRTDFSRLTAPPKQKEIRKRWLAGERENIVFGWQTGTRLLRLLDCAYQWPEGVEALETAILAGIVLGYTADLPEPLVPQSEPTAEVTGQPFAWRRAAQAQIKQIRRRAITALAEQFQAVCRDEAVAKSFILLLEPFSKLETVMGKTQKNEAYQLFVNKLWRSRDGYEEKAEALVMWEKAAKTLAMAGIEESVLHEADGRTAVRQQCERVLGYWYGQDYKHAGVVKRTWRHLQEARRVLQEGGWLVEAEFAELDEGLTAVSEVVQETPFFQELLARGELVREAV